MSYLKPLANWDTSFHIALPSETVEWKSNTSHGVSMWESKNFVPTQGAVSRHRRFAMKIKMCNVLHPNTNSGDWLAKSFPPWLYVSDVCQNHRQAIYGYCTVSYGMSARLVTGRGVQSSAGVGEEMWWDSAPRSVPRHSPTHARDSCSALSSLLGHVPPGCATRCCETFPGLMQS